MQKSFFLITLFILTSLFFSCLCAPEVAPENNEHLPMKPEAAYTTGPETIPGLIKMVTTPAVWN